MKKRIFSFSQRVFFTGYEVPRPGSWFSWSVPIVIFFDHLGTGISRAWEPLRAEQGSGRWPFQGHTTNKRQKLESVLCPYMLSMLLNCKSSLTFNESYGLCGRGRGWGDFGEWHWNMYNIMYETSRQSRFKAQYWMLGAGALGQPRGRVWGGRWEEGSGWGTQYTCGGFISMFGKTNTIL